jgi:hypothetical protein
MKDNRRDFIRKTVLGTAGFSSLGGVTAYGNMACTRSGSHEETNNKKLDSPRFTQWEVNFDESYAKLSISNGPLSITGFLSFTSDDVPWVISKSRDAISERFALVNPGGDVQGYFVFPVTYCNEVRMLFYHRTAQNFRGILSFKGEIRFYEDSFSCRTKAVSNERVLNLSCGNADSLLNDSLFSPQNDVLGHFSADSLNIKTQDKGIYSFIMSGQIHESSGSVFGFQVEDGYLRKRYVPYYHPIDRKRVPKAPTGWMSWNTYFDKATAEDNLNEAKIGQKYLQPFGCEFWSIESWQGNSDQLPVSDFYNMNLEVNEKQFPEGMKKLAEDIRTLGFRPGLWTAPFGTGNQQFYEEHKDWFLHYTDGKPVSSWNGRYTLDPTVPEAIEHLKEIHRIASREWGYEFFKIDGMSGRSMNYSAHLYERPEIKVLFKNPECSNPFEVCVKAFRDGMGEDRVFLACQGHTSGPEALYADASRIGADIVDILKPIQWHNIHNQGYCTINQIFTHNIAMIADPDTLLVNDLDIEQARVTATIVALPGQLTFFGDKLAGLSGDKMKILQQTLPVADVRSMNLYPYFSMLPVWNLFVRNKILNPYNVVALFNWNDKPENIGFLIKELGLAAAANYIGYEYWTQTYLGAINEKFEMNIPPRSVRLLALHKQDETPKWISSDRHISQNGIELKAYGWDDGNKVISGTVELVGSFPLSMKFYVPLGFKASEAECSNTECRLKVENDRLISVSFLAEKSGVFPFKIYF